MTTVLLPWQGANIGRDATPDETRRAIRSVRHGGPAGLPRPGVAWQEVNDDNRPVDERAIIDATFGRFTTWPRHEGSRGCHVPVTVPDPWTMVEQHAYLIGHGKAHVQPDRYLTLRVMEHPALARPVGFASWQQVAGAYTHPGQPAEHYRRVQWGDQFGEVRDRLLPVADDGITVVYAADTNRPRCPLLRWDDHRVTQQDLDALGFIPGRGRRAVDVRVRARWRVPLPIDGHDGTGALLALS